MMKTAFKSNLMKTKISHKERIVRVVKRRGSIIPALVANKVVYGMYMPFNVDRRCRELKEEGYLKAEQESGMRKWVATQKLLKYGVKN